jgi:hypothetical protein
MQRENYKEKREREHLEAMYGQVWNTSQLKSDFVVYEFLHRSVRVLRKIDGKRGTLLYQNFPRFYFSFLEEKSTDGT